MPDDRRNCVPGGAYLFTVNLRDRHSKLLVVEIAALRDALRADLARRRFHIDAWVVFFGSYAADMDVAGGGDTDFSGRMREIKSGLTRRIVRPQSRITVTLRQRQSRSRPQRYRAAQK